LRPVLPVIVLTLIPFAWAQDEPPLRVDVGLVNVAFSARGPDGKFIQNLTREEVEVFEDGVPQEIKFFGTRSDLPLTVGLLEDFSASQDKFNRKHSSDTEKFLKQVIHPGDGAFLVCFGNHVRLVSDLTSSAEAIQKAMHEFDRHPSRFPLLGPPEKRFGGTALFDAVFFAARNRMKALTGRKAMLVFSDGEDNASERGLGTAIEAAEGADALVYSVRYTEVKHKKLSKENIAGMADMKRLAAETGGREFDAGNIEMSEVFDEIGQELRSLCELAYTPANREHDGRFRHIEVRARRPGVTIRARLGYFPR
jgi:Ca-activated chloride channel family protein